MRLKQTTNILIAGVSAAALSIALVAAPAYADCPNGQTFSNGIDSNVNGSGGFGANFGLNGGLPADSFDSGSETDPDCYTAGAISIGQGSAVTGVIITDSGDEDAGVYVPSITAAYGEGSSAFGHGATVGTVETYTETVVDDGGTPGDDSDDVTEDVTRTRIVPVNNGTALGAGASVQHNNSTAVGAGAATSEENQVVLGTEEDTVTARGIASDKSKARQSGVLEVVTTDASGNLASDGGAFASAINGNSAAINANTAQLSQHAARLDDLEGGIAAVAAIPDAYLELDKKFAIAGGFGGYGGDVAFGAIATIRLNQNVTAYGGGGFSVSGDSDAVWKGGARFAW